MSPSDILFVVFSILTAVISSGALLVSYQTYKKTTASKFDGVVQPSSRIALSWINYPDDIKIPCIITNCAFLNFGALVGNVDDVMLSIKDQSLSGAETPFQALLVMENIDLFAEDGQDQQNFASLSTVWLKGGQTIEKNILFTPNHCAFDIEKPTTLKETVTFYAVDPKSRKPSKWKMSEVFYNYVITAEDIDDWRNKKKTVPLESVQLKESRIAQYRA